MTQNTVNSEERLKYFAVAILNLLFENYNPVPIEEFKKTIMEAEFGIGRIKAESLIYEVLKTPMFVADEKYIYRS